MAQTIFAVHCRTVRSGSKLGHTAHTGQYGSISQFSFFYWYCYDYINPYNPDDVTVPSWKNLVRELGDGEHAIIRQNGHGPDAANLLS